jgi:hypothetical protein
MTVELTAYELSPNEWTIEPASTRRGWMDQTPHKAAYRCLPLIMANQIGWIIRCPVRIKATWDGAPKPRGLTIEYGDEPDRYRQEITSTFGLGILSFAIPWLFRTSPGYGLIVRGPTNFPKLHLTALDGLVETDWAPFTFTMNWKINTSRIPVMFEKGEPICMIIPYPLDLPEQVKPRIVKAQSNPELMNDLAIWVKARKEQEAHNRVSTAKKFGLDYMRGQRPNGEPAPKHRTALNLQTFADERQVP